MKIVLYTVCVSQHQLPLAEELVRRVGADNFAYVYQEELKGCLQAGGATAPWIVPASDATRELLETCDLLLCGPRDLALWQTRAAKGLKTFYLSERWFKPIRLGIFAKLGKVLPFCRHLQLSGGLRLLSPGFARLGRETVRLLAQADSGFAYWPYGVWAKRDMELIARVFGKRIPAEKITVTGYCVRPSTLGPRTARPAEGPLRVLWLGRMIDWKRTEVVVQALRYERLAEKCRLTLVGGGPEKPRLERLAKGLPVDFVPSVPLAEVRPLLRAHDVYVLTSDGGEGWGASLNEALEEGVSAVGTREAGASATLLDDTRLAAAGSPRSLARILSALAEERRTTGRFVKGLGLRKDAPAWTAATVADEILAKAFG